MHTGSKNAGSRPHVTIPIYTPSHVSLFTDEGSWSLTEMLDLFVIDLANVLQDYHMSLPSHSGLYHMYIPSCCATMSHVDNFCMARFSVASNIIFTLF